MTGDALRAFVLRAKTVEEFAIEARAELLDRLTAGETIEGAKLVQNAPTTFVHWHNVSRLAALIGPVKIAHALGDIPLKKFSELWGDKPIPNVEMFDKPGARYVRVTHPKPKANAVKQ